MLLVVTRSSQNDSPLEHWEPVMLVTPPNDEQPQIEDTAPNLQDMTATARPNLSDALSSEMVELLTKYGDIFVMKSDHYGQTERVTHRIGMGEARAICQPLRRLLLAKHADVGKILKDMQRCEVIEELREPLTIHHHSRPEVEWGPAFLRRLQETE
jgi:hypothetical protein